MNPFLRAKHWQIFLVFFGVPFFFQFWWMDDLLSAMPKPGDDPEMVNEIFFGTILDMMPLLLGLGALILVLQMSWFISVALGLRKFTPAGVRLRRLPFIVSFMIPVLYFVLVGRFVYHLFLSDFARPEWLYSGAVGLVFAIHFLSMACMFYLVYYTAKAFKTALLKRKVNREEVIGEFFMILFLFAGIWVLQPRINQIIEGETDPEEAESGDPDFSKYSN